METYFQTAENAADSRKWFVVDANGKTLGRLATEVATLLRGKNKVTFTRHNDGGDFVIVLNTALVNLTGTKRKTKIYKHHTGYIGGIKRIPAGDMIDRNPDRVIELAVMGMLPKGPLGRDIMRKLKLYPGTEHPHAAQMPTVYELKFHN